MAGLPKKQATCHPDKKHIAKGLCKSCYGKAHYNVSDRKEEYHQRYERDKEKIKARARDRYHNYRKHLPGEMERAKEATRRSRLKNPEKYRLYHRDWYRQKTYGITIEQIRELFERNGGLCWICSERPAVHIDHDHETDEVRGALCRNCNVGIGHLDDDIGLLLKAIQYLKTGKVVSNEQS